MSKWQLFNGEFVAHGAHVVSVQNRSFCYGDGFFESMKISDGKLPFAKLHWNRLVKATEFLRIEMPNSFTLAAFENAALELCKRNGLANARVRFQGFRSGQGRYAPDNNFLEWSMVCEETEHPEYRLNGKGLVMDFCRSNRINPAPQSSFKSSNSLPYILAGMYARDEGFDDCFLLDSEGFVAEATSSNVFLFQRNKLFTPDLTNGGVAGVMRNVVIRAAKELGIELVESLISEDDVLQADECFLTNASGGIRWVAAVGKKRYFKRFAAKLMQHVNTRYELLS